ncbi:MAG: hypothetical protein P8J33_13985 [Pirellulaceae bacterium]|nr:hypothetical protein [Pirellulaceae bacterium]
MSSQQTKRNRRLFRQAEGFLELATLFDDRFPLSVEGKSNLAEQCLATLAQIQEAGMREFRVFYLKGQALRLAERYSEAIDALERAFELDSSNIHTCLALAWCFKRCDQITLAVDTMHEAQSIDQESGIVQYNLACYLALLNKPETSLIHLARAIQIDSQYRELAQEESDFDLIRDDPDFQAKTAAAL